MFGILTIILSCSSSNNENEVTETATCFDGVQNGNETGIDCGGTACFPCEVEVFADIPDVGYTSPTSYDGYNLVWSDEFNSDTLDSDKWSFHLANGCPNLCGWGNNELQYYTNDNHYFDGGNLVIRAKNEDINGFNYSSTRINSDNKFEFQYGRIDIRASMPSAIGTWVAFWLLNKDYQVQNPAAEWPSGGEIDIMEYLGQDKDSAFGTAHFGSDLSNHNFISGYYDAPNQDFDKEFYVFSILWEENSIKWLINDVEYHSFTPNSTRGQPYPFNDEFYILMNLSVGGNLPVAPIASQYPAFVIIDYIRVFQPN